MPTSKTTQKKTRLAQELTLEELYDALMYEVEPELTFDAMQYVNDWYLGETLEEKSVRMARYERAFEIVEERMKKLMTSWEDELISVKNKILASQNK
jgi:hypothetical protein